MNTPPAGFLDAVTAYLREHQGLPTAEATHVTSETNDWVGDTESGFDTAFTVTIAYTIGDRSSTLTVGADEMEGLWDYVVRGYRTVKEER